MPYGAAFVLEQHAVKLDAERKPVTGADGLDVADRFVAFTVMGHRPRVGEPFPEDDAAQLSLELRRLLSRHQAARRRQPGRMPGLPQPPDKTSFLFSLEPLKKVAKAR